MRISSILLLAFVALPWTAMAQEAKMKPEEFTPPMPAVISPTPAPACYGLMKPDLTWDRTTDWIRADLVHAAGL